MDGNWGSSLQQASDAFIFSTTQKVSGTVTFKLTKGGFFLCSVIAKDPLYLTDRDRWEIKVSKSRSQLSLGKEKTILTKSSS